VVAKAASAAAPQVAAAKPAAAPAAQEAARAQALLEGKPADAKPAPKDGARYIVQVGAFADAAAARETRSKVEKLGLKTYTQVTDTASGQRIRVRVGPFASRDEADRAMAKAKAAGVAAVVLTL
jgi:DedD protein